MTFVRSEQMKKIMVRKHIQKRNQPVNDFIVSDSLFNNSFQQERQNSPKLALNPLELNPSRAPPPAVVYDDDAANAGVSVPAKERKNAL